MFGWFKRNSEIEQIKSEVKGSFDNVKGDVDRIGKWITHLNNRDVSLNSQVSNIKEDIATIKDEIEQLKNVISMFGEGVSKQLFKRPSNKQTAVYGVQTAVQTAVQTGNFNKNFNGVSNLSVTEKAIVWILLNNELKLSYEDIAAILGKTKSTIRGQINSIKQKSEGLICESSESNGKKRVFIPDEIREKLLKNVKVRVKNQKKKKKYEEND